MSKLPDLEALSIFAKVAELRSFAAASEELGLSKPTVSKAVSRLEHRLGTRLFNRTSRQLALTDAGQRLMPKAARLLADAEAAESEMLNQSVTPRGLLRLAVPMSFGVREVAPALPGFLAQYPQVSVDLHLSDETVDLIGGGYDAALRIAALPDSSLVARRLAPIPRLLVCAPCYLEGRTVPEHPRDLMDHSCLSYAYLATPEVWHFTHKGGEQVSVSPAGQLKANNADALTPALFSGLGIALQPEFVVGPAVRDGRLAVLLPDWQTPAIALHLVMPPGGPRPARVEALAAYLGRYFSKGERGKAEAEMLGIKE